MEEGSVIQKAREVLKIEAESIIQLIDKVDRNFHEAVDIICASKGRVIVSGIGKSGLIGKKIVATLTSTGTQAVFLHPVEGMHGDLGLVTREDVLIAISNSGETPELNLLIESIRAIGARLIAFTGNPRSTLARLSDVVIDIGVEKEACPFGLAPTSSTTAALAMGDALAVVLIEKKSFREEDFYKFHPGGNLGLRLRAKVREVTEGGEKVPRVLPGVSSVVAITEMDSKNLGFVLVADGGDRVLGILTDGDLRRLIRKGHNFNESKIDEIMTMSPKVIDENASVAEAIAIMQRYEITTLVVVNGNKELTGYIHLHDLLGRGGSLKISV
jgi:arabinose-5-phosphate isomerase